MGQVVAFRAPYRAQTELISGINMTPFIDVLLVLLVMLIMTVPMVTHQIPIDLPQPGRTTEPVVPPHQLAIDRQGALSFDGAPVGDAELPARLAAMHGASDKAVLTLKTDPEARYERFDAVLAVVKRAGITRLGFDGNRPFDD